MAKVVRISLNSKFFGTIKTHFLKNAVFGEVYSGACNSLVYSEIVRK